MLFFYVSNKSPLCSDLVYGEFGNKLHKLNELRKTASGAICLTVYKVMMCPAIDYCSFYTGGAHSGELLKLQRMQNRALRICERVAIRDRSIVN